uniref:HTH CENPB-type domain-containing protein n=1 Tax=Labrus bergylta TaxID=56723 RepID=A0A3Q3FBL7_9LABR
VSNWFTGPNILWQKELRSEEIMVGEIPSSDPELKKVHVLETKAKEVRSLLDHLQKFSDWSRAVKAIARLKRRARVTKGLKARSSEAISLQERREAEIAIIKMVQETTLSKEIWWLHPASLATLAKMERKSDHLEKSGSKVGQVNQQQRRSYDANFKIMVVNSAESSNNCQAAKKYGVTECNVRRWRAQKERLKDANSQRKSSAGRFGEIDQRVFEYVREKRSEGMSITRAVIQLKALEIARELNISEFKSSLGWCRRMMWHNGLALRRRTSLAQHLDFREKLLSFQRFVIKLRKKHSYPLHQIGNADQTPVYFDMPTSVTVNKKGEKSVLVRSTGNERSRVTVMLTCLADGSKLLPYVILKRKTVPKEPMPAGIIVRAQEKGWMETGLVVDWLKVVWGGRYGGLRKKRNMLVLDAFRGHLTDDLVIIPGGMTSQLQVLDVVGNKLFKDNLQKSYTRVAPVWKARAHTDREDPEAVSPSAVLNGSFCPCETLCFEKCHNSTCF